MPAIFTTLGPIYHFIRPASGTGGPWLYLGTAETSPESDSTPGLLPVMNDIGGRTFPMQYVNDRRQDLVTTTINRINHTTYNVLRNTLPINGGVPAEYRDTFVDNGSLVIGGSDFQLALVYGFGSVSGVNSADTPRGRMYFSAIPRKFKETSVGTRVMTVSILFECNGLYVPGDRSFRLYNENPSLWSGATPE